MTENVKAVGEQLNYIDDCIGKLFGEAARSALFYISATRCHTGCETWNEIKAEILRHIGDRLDDNHQQVQYHVDESRIHGREDYWYVRCKCGKMESMSIIDLLSGKYYSCGCTERPADWKQWEAYGRDDGDSKGAGAVVATNGGAQ